LASCRHQQQKGSLVVIPAAESLDVRDPPPSRAVQAGIHDFTGRTKGSGGWPAFAGHDGWRVGTFGRRYELQSRSDAVPAASSMPSASTTTR
jgi:hypothetical protein